MNSYRSHIVDVLAENMSLSRNDLFAKLGMTSRREFRTVVDRLMREERIRYESVINGGGSALYPKVLKLVEFQTRHGTHTRTFIINYVPTPLLEKVLEYTAPGIDPFEDNLDFHLEIMGYPLEEKYKTFFEQENGFILDYSKFNYTLCAEYLFPKYSDLSPQTSNVILVDDIDESASEFMEIMKPKIASSGNWFHFFNNYDAEVFLENTFLNRTFISVIIFRCRISNLSQDFLLKMDSVINRHQDAYTDIYIPVLILTEPGTSIDVEGFVIRREIGCMYYPFNEDEAILGNVLQTQCNKSR